MNAPSRLQPTVVTPDRAPSIKPFGLDMKVMLSTEATGGALSILTGWLKPGEGPTDHYHLDRDEVFFIVEGTIELTVGGNTSTIGAGSVALISRATVHRFRNVGATTACLLDLTLPGGQDHFFKAISELAASGGFTGEKATEIARQFDTNFVASS
jgi:mannose-6-phosphate isomerase-like protein (cupin superfamily)